MVVTAGWTHAGSWGYFMSLDRPNISERMMVTMEKMPPTRYLIDSTF